MVELARNFISLPDHRQKEAIVAISRAMAHTESDADAEDNLKD